MDSNYNIIIEASKLSEISNATNKHSESKQADDKDNSQIYSM